MSFNSTHIINTRDVPLSEATTKTKARGIGVQPNQPLVNSETTLKPVISLFVAGNSTESITPLPNLDNIAVIGLSQVVITGLPQLGAPIVIAAHFKGSQAEFSLQNTGYHNMTNVPRSSIFIYYDGSGTAIAAFGGEPIILCQKRSPVDFKSIELEFINTDTGRNLSYDKFFLWMFCQPINWQ